MIIFIVILWFTLNINFNKDKIKYFLYENHNNKEKKVLLSIDKTFHNIDISFLEKIKGEEGNTYFINNKFNLAGEFFLK